MAKVIMCSRFFPAYHPRKGEPTYFVEKINAGLDWKKYGIAFGDETEKHFKNLGIEYSHKIMAECKPKYHTIRAGHRFKDGDYASLRCWSGKPYRSKQIIIAPDVLIKKTYDFSVDLISPRIYLNGVEVEPDKLELIAVNDGLNTADLKAWFKFPKPGQFQIISWADESLLTY